jgi:hypothetical protein
MGRQTNRVRRGLSSCLFVFFVEKRLVRKAGLEPAWLAPPPPQDGVSANSTTSAFRAGSHRAEIHLMSFYPDLWF